MSDQRQQKQQTLISRAHQSLSYPFSASYSFSSSLILCMAEEISLWPNTTSLSMVYQNLPTLPRSSESTLANVEIGTIYTEMDKEWRPGRYLLNAVDVVLYPQHNALTEHRSLLNLGT